jgi:dolichol-phosphate mannosyltransferase
MSISEAPREEQPGSPNTSTASARLSVLMPVYNEEETVEAIIADVLAVRLDLELIVVDDGSTDTTRPRLRELEALSHHRLKIIYAPHNAGKGAAIRVALSHAVGDVIVIQDADREYDPRDFVPMLARIDAGAAVVYGTRLSATASRMNNEGRHNKFYYARRVLPVLTNMLFGTRLTDEATCYKMFRREVLMSIPLRCERFDFCPEVTAKIARRGYKIYEVPIHYEARSEAEGKKIGWHDAVDAVVALVKFRIID